MISVSHLVAGYQEAAVLDGVSLTLRQGQVLTVLGSNGAGKTTLLRAISGLLRPWRGEIRFNDKCITGCSPTEVVALGIAHVPEGRRVFPGLTVKQNLRIGAYTVRDTKRVRDNFERVYDLFPILRERQGQVATTLSGGEQQMLAIGRALMSEPNVLMLDEPTMGLAPIVVERLHDALQRLVRTGITILLVEQNAAFAMQLADSVAVLQMGRIVNAGRKDEMPDVQALVSAYLGV